MEEINVTQEMEQAVEDVVTNSDLSLSSVVGVAAIIGGVLCGAFGLYKFIKDKKAQRQNDSDDKTDITIEDCVVNTSETEI